MPSIQENYLTVTDLIAKTCAQADIDTNHVKLLVVSKRWPAEIVKQVVDCGHKLLGESRIQEAELKIPSLPADIEWHFIGHIQKNKVRKILPLFNTLHSVDSLDLAQRIDTIAADLGRCPNIFLQVNIAAEESKHGFSPDELRQQIHQLLALKHVHVLGLMAIPPEVENPDDSRPQFRAVRDLQAELSTITGFQFTELSMGMSGDYQAAIEEGSTIVRVGSSVFGDRQ